MTDSSKADAPILAAGGIVLRDGSRPRVAIVRLRGTKTWVLPKGKLYAGESALAAARREVLEETGHEVSVHEFFGTMSYTVDGKIKIVQFWLMRAIGGPVRELDKEIKAVKWLPLQEAIDTLSRANEKIFLANAGPAALKAAKRAGLHSVTKSSDRMNKRRADSRYNGSGASPGPRYVESVERLASRGPRHSAR